MFNMTLKLIRIIITVVVVPVGKKVEIIGTTRRLLLVMRMESTLPASTKYVIE